VELLERRILHLVRDVEEQLEAPDVIPATRKRCRAMVRALTGQLDDVRGILEPALPARSGPLPEIPRDEVPATLEYLPYLHRDWASSGDPDGENERAVATIEDVLDGTRPGRTLVLGAGACRLAYDLSRRYPDAEVMVLDRDPLLFLAAHAVTHGRTLTLREANLEVGELDQLSKEWALTAPADPVDDDRFHFLVADAVDPPLAPDTFDTVLTPWFIDQGPEDVRDLLGTLHGLLRPDGRWVNLGPLRYDLDVPMAHRFSREELFDLARRAGFHVERWRSESAPYLVSALNGRGKVEWVLAFAAHKTAAREEGARSGEGPPPWLLFGHFPIPTFSGQSMFWSESAAVRRVVSAIDGRRTLDDLARMVADDAGEPDLTPAQVRGAVRELLARVHPACAAEE
jgi:SAM-dependent methyltransferase